MYVMAEWQDEVDMKPGSYVVTPVLPYSARMSIVGKPHVGYMSGRRYALKSLLDDASAFFSSS